MMMAPPPAIGSLWVATRDVYSPDSDQHWFLKGSILVVIRPPDNGYVCWHCLCAERALTVHPDNLGSDPRADMFIPFDASAK